MIHRVAHFAAWTLNNPWTLGPMCMALVFVPVLGMWAVHKYGWEHWAPFDRGHKQGYTQYRTDWNTSVLTSPREKRIGIQPAWERGGNPLEPVSVILQDITDALLLDQLSGRASRLHRGGRRFDPVIKHSHQEDYEK